MNETFWIKLLVVALFVLLLFDCHIHYCVLWHEEDNVWGGSKAKSK